MEYTIKHQSQVWAIMRSSKLSRNQARSLGGYLVSLERRFGIKRVIQILNERAEALKTPKLDRFRKRGDHWIGPFRPLSVMASRGRRYKKFALRVLRLHTIFRAKPASLSDYSKAETRLSSREDRELGHVPEKLIAILSRAYEKIRIRHDDVYPMSSRKAPMGLKSVQECWALPVDHIESMDAYPQLVSSHYEYFAKLVGEAMPEKQRYITLSKARASKKSARIRKIPWLGQDYKITITDDIAGRVTILNKDGSCKHRLVANANRILQLACSPVHNATMDFLKQHPDSYVFDQLAGVEKVYRMLKDDIPLSSIDLDSASDNIPLLAQVRLLKLCVPSLSEPLDIFYQVSRMKWLTPYKQINIKWTCGSPMGVKGSFGLFTFFVLVILEQCGARGSFAIVGDDVVVDSRYEKKFLKLLESYNIPISASKSLFTHFEFAEFCGKIIDRYGNLEVYKGSGLRFRDVLGLVRKYGLDAIRHFSRFRRLSPPAIRAITMFYLLEQAGIDFLRDILRKKDVPDLQDGGLSAKQIVRVLQLPITTIEQIAPRDGELSAKAKAHLRRRMHSLSLEAIQALDRERRVVNAWNFACNDPDMVDYYVHFVPSTPAHKRFMRMEAEKKYSHLPKHGLTSAQEMSLYPYHAFIAYMDDCVTHSAADVIKIESDAAFGVLPESKSPVVKRETLAEAKEVVTFFGSVIGSFRRMSRAIRRIGKGAFRRLMIK